MAQPKLEFFVDFSVTSGNFENMAQEQRQRELAHILLTELLAYQFAMPVRWTETQTVLFDRFKARKLVEVGPSSTLLNMARKTLGQFNVESDAVNRIERDLLAVTTHYEDLCYTSAPSIDESQESQTINEPKAIPLAPERGNDVAVAPLQTIPVSGNEPIPDAPVSALDSITAIVASSLRKSSSAINLNESLKGLSGGRSTIQNEMVGDLLAEFGQLPDNVENIPLTDLASAIQATYDGKPGKVLRSRIDKMMAAKMPASFSIAAVRSYLSGAWGLGSGRQDAVLLLALSQQPSARFKDSKEAETFLDGIAQKHLDSAGLARQIARAAGPSAEEALIDSKALSQLRSEQDSLRAKIAALLRPEQDSNNTVFEDTDQSALSLYERELGDEFCNGIKPIFHAGHQRSYQSAWNWTHIELLSVYYRCVEAQKSGREPGRHDLLAIERILADKSNSRLDGVRNFLIRQEASHNHGATTKLGEALAFPGDDLEPDETASSNDISGDDSYDDLGDLDEISTLQNMSPNLFNGLFTGQPMGFDMHVASQVETKQRPLLQVLRRRGPSWVSHERLTKRVNIDFPLSLNEFSGKYVLMTGTGPNSIGIAILPKLLRAGARVVVGTSRTMSDAGPFYQKVFASHGVPGSRLVILPCNQGSSQDVHDLISHIYDPVNGLGWDLDIVLPLAAVPEKGREMDELDSKSELAHRAMLVNTLRGLGAIKKAKEARGIRTRPTLVLLPLSPNMGTFGSDGLYSESKMGLMATLHKWSSESWSEYLSICGVVIGWTRGTGLMAANDALAQRVEELGVTTFSIDEMASHLCKLLTDPFASFCQTEPLVADFSGGMSSNPDLAASLAEVRLKAQRDQEIKRALADEQVLDAAATEVSQISSATGSSSRSLPSLVNLGVDFPTLPDYSTGVQPLNATLAGMVDLESVVVVVGFAELGPWGNSRTRWEMELKGELSPRACIELAWMTGMIKPNKSSEPSAAEWIDSLTSSPVKDSEVQAKYEKRILECTGLRLIQPSPLDHPSRDKKRFLQEVLVQEDLAPFTASYETAMDFVREHGSEKVQVRQTTPGADECFVKIRKGAVIMVPKATVYDRIVGGQIPTGWDPRVYGLPEDICESVDRCTLMSLVCAAEAFQSAGITDVYELFRTMHVSELANCVGSGMGGGQSLQKLYRERFLEKEVQSDILAETFINTTSAWLNMLLMGASGPTRTPVGACATALESLNQGYDLIISNTAKVCLVGGFDDMTQDTSAEFANMKATNNSAADLQDHGRAPHETCRPCTTSRAGFVESEGCGMQVLTNAKTALELGLPIHAVVAHVSTSSDGIGRSVPAPGQGLMTQVRESSTASSSPLLDIRYRKSMLDLTLRHIQERYSMLHPGNLPPQQGHAEAAAYADEMERAQKREENEARRRFGNDFWKGDSRIAPLRGALSVWGLTADDIGVLSLHGTSTQANEKNEVAVLHQQMSRLGRSPGNAAPVVCQKYLTGHPKGAAAAWMLNGCCQILDCGIIPGNRNADDIDAVLEPYDNLVFPDRALDVGDVRAFSVTSFGFGQKGAQALGVHPRFLYATLENRSMFDEYSRRRDERCRKTERYFRDGIYEGRLVELKKDPPYDKNQVEAMVNPAWRLT